MGTRRRHPYVEVDGKPLPKEQVKISSVHGAYWPVIRRQIAERESSIREARARAFTSAKAQDEQFV